MPATPAALARAGKAALNFYVRQSPPVDQIAVRRPWLEKLIMAKKAFPGGKEAIVEQLRKSYDGNLQWYSGDQTVTYNRRDPLANATYPWKSCHDGFSLSDDDLARNGIHITPTGNRTSLNRLEVFRLTNILKENFAILDKGFDEKLDQALLVSGSTNTDAVTGLDGLVTLAPTAGTVGGISRSASANAWWRNNVRTGLTQANMLDELEKTWRDCVEHGSMPDFIMVGDEWLDRYRAAVKDEIDRYTIVRTSGEVPNMDGKVGKTGPWGIRTGLHFNQIEIFWNPVFTPLQAATSATTSWRKRGYFITCADMKLRPMEGYQGDGYAEMAMMPTTYDRYTYYWAKRSKLALTMEKANGHSATAIS